MSRNFYSQEYFNSSIFEFDYQPLAAAIMKEYGPKTIVEFGCGKGDLSKALSQAGAMITAIDGYATPDFNQYPNIKFLKVDLNDPLQIESFLSLGQKFNVAICLEVAEHLNPTISEVLVNALTASADVVIFSAAIPEQGGDGHINCQERSFWHQEFGKKHFFLRDTIRSQIRNNSKVGRWYALNTLDYVLKLNEPSPEEFRTLIDNLISSESASASHFYLANRRLEYSQQILKMDMIWWAYRLRNSIKRICGKPINVFDKF